MDEMTIEVDTATPSIRINGEDISQFVRGISFVQGLREPAIIGIEIGHPAKVRVEGPAFLQNLVDSADVSAAATVKSLNWDKLKEEALNGLDFGDDPMDALLNKIVEILNGHQS